MCTEALVNETHVLGATMMRLTMCDVYRGVSKRNSRVGRHHNGTGDVVWGRVRHHGCIYVIHDAIFKKFDFSAVVFLIWAANHCQLYKKHS